MTTLRTALANLLHSIGLTSLAAWVAPTGWQPSTDAAGGPGPADF